MSKGKTNKSFTKRLKVSKNGKMRSRQPGLNHFNAREAGEKKLGKRCYQNVEFTNKTKNDQMPHS